MQHIAREGGLTYRKKGKHLSVCVSVCRNFYWLGFQLLQNVPEKLMQQYVQWKENRSFLQGLECPAMQRALPFLSFTVPALLFCPSPVLPSVICSSLCCQRWGLFPKLGQEGCSRRIFEMLRAGKSSARAEEAAGVISAEHSHKSYVFSFF